MSAGALAGIIVAAVLLPLLLFSVVMFELQNSATTRKRIEMAKAQTAAMLAAAITTPRPGYGGCPSATDLGTFVRGQTDPWGEPYDIRCISGTITVTSPGPDRKLGTSDDIVEKGSVVY
jgi:hypothetical protein